MWQIFRQRMPIRIHRDSACFSGGGQNSRGKSQLSICYGDRAKKTDNFNLYSNPYAFGPPTATGSHDWVGGANSIAKEQSMMGFQCMLQLPFLAEFCQDIRIGPEHRGEFAPFAPNNIIMVLV